MIGGERRGLLETAWANGNSGDFFQGSRAQAALIGKN